MEVEIIDYFVWVSRLLRQPRSLGEIYGLLFISARPLAVEHLIRLLRLSRSSALMGVRSLERLGFVRPARLAGERHLYYEAVTELGPLLARFVGGVIGPEVETRQARLERVAVMLRGLSPDEASRLKGRIKTVLGWNKSGMRFLRRARKTLSR